jgi:hypothetical protein
VGVARAWHGPTLNASGGKALSCLSLSHLCWHEDSSCVGEWPDSDTRYEGLAPPAGDYLVRARDLHHLMEPTQLSGETGPVGWTQSPKTTQQAVWMLMATGYAGRPYSGAGPNGTTLTARASGALWPDHSPALRPARQRGVTPTKHSRLD